MKWITLFTYIFLFSINSFCQTEGWVSTCPTNGPQLSEIMIDACGDNEFYSEYVLLRVGNQPFDVRQYGLKVTNPANNAFIGSVSIIGDIVNERVINQLNSIVGNICPFGTVFRDAFALPYKGIVPPNTALIIFNNKDSIDVSFIPADALSRLCGSKVFVAYGTIKTQSPGVSIFRNHPRNGSCLPSGCLRTIESQFEGPTTPFCTKIIYDIKNLPHLPGTNPPDGYGDGSYITAGPNNTISYKGGNLTGNGICFPPDNMLCKIPPQPDYGDGFWQVLVYEGLQNFNSFKGYYSAKGGHTPSVSAPDSSFEFNTAKDGWLPQQAPSEAHPAYGALAVYDGCNVKADSFSIVAKRRNFPCGEYRLRLGNRDDYTRVRIDARGDGVFEYDQTFDPKPCANNCGEDIWTGFLNADSKIEIYGSDAKGDFNLVLVFNKIKISKSCVPCKTDTIRLVSQTCNPTKVEQFTRIATNISGCDTVFMNIVQLVSNTINFHISLIKSISYTDKKDAILQVSNIKGGFSPYQIRWNTGDTTTTLKDIGKGVYRLTVSDKNECARTDSIVLKDPILATTQSYFLPNSFSPNGDGVNDMFMPYTNADITLILNFQIYDQWGNQVFQVLNALPNDKSSAWDGILRGRPLPPDVYIYSGSVEFKNGKKEVFGGSVTLFK